MKNKNKYNLNMALAYALVLITLNFFVLAAISINELNSVSAKPSEPYVSIFTLDTSLKLPKGAE